MDNPLRASGPEGEVARLRYFPGNSGICEKRCLLVANRFLKWEPVTELLREIYEGDVSLMNGRPLEWWGQEPFQATRQDWRTHYASVF